MHLLVVPFAKVKWLCAHVEKRTGSPDICIVDGDNYANATPQTAEETNKKKSRMAEEANLVTPPPAKSAKQGKGKAAAKSAAGGTARKKTSNKGRLADLPKLIKIGGQNFELKWLSMHENAETLVSIVP